jgi:hypothetical protein
MDNTFMIEEDYPPGTKILVDNGDNADGTIRILEQILQRTTRIVPTNRYLGRRIIAIDLSQIPYNADRRRIEDNRVAAWREQAAAARPYDNNNIDPNAIPPGRVFVPSGGRKSRRGRKNKKSRKTQSMKRRSNRRRGRR